MPTVLDVTAEQRRISEEILRVLLPHRRADGEGMAHDHERAGLHACFADQIDQIGWFVSEGRRLLLTLPAFPCKSPNREKVLSHLPDLGERASLRFLSGLCAQIEKVYSPGAEILICSDGHVFGDLIHVPDPDIDAYAVALRRMLGDEGITNIGFFSLADVYGERSFDEKRRRLTDVFAVPLEDLRKEVRTDEKTLHLYRGITRFLIEDMPGDHPGTKSARQRDCRRRAYGVIQRSRAWSSLIAEHHPRSLRLSIHPQPCGSEKFGIALLELPDMWVTPWHSVAVRRPDGRLMLMKRADAEKVGELVYSGGAPSHYQLG